MSHVEITELTFDGYLDCEDTRALKQERPVNARMVCPIHGQEVEARFHIHSGTGYFVGVTRFFCDAQV